MLSWKFYMLDWKNKQQIEKLKEVPNKILQNEIISC